MSTRQELTDVSLKTEKVDLPGGKSVFVKELMQGEAASLKGKNDAYFFAFGVVGEDGRRLFDPNDPGDVAVIEKMPVAIVRAAVKKLLEISGFIDSEEAAKN